jgi:multidrug resistance protein, MATE family
MTGHGAAPQLSETAALLGEGGLQAVERIAENDRQQSNYGTNDEDVWKQDSAVKTTWQAESKLLFRYSAPLILTYLLQYSFNLVTVFVAGHIGTNELGAVSLATMTANITGLVVYEGFATSLDTLTSQAYGAGKKRLVGLHVQRMIVLLAIATIPIGVIWICSPWILELIVPEKELAYLAGKFLRIYLIGAPGFAFFEAGKRFTQAQGNFTASLVVLLICAPLNIFLNWLFVWKMRLGFEGIALAVALSNTVQPLILVAYIQLFARETLECWPPIHLPTIISNWKPQIQLAVSGVLMIFCEWLAFDILTFSSSYLSTAHLAAQSVVMTVCVTMYHIPFPISIAASTRFGNLIGFGALKAARTAFRAHYVIFVFIGIFDICLLTSLRHVIPKLFTADPEVRSMIVGVVPIVAAAQFFDATTALSNALLRGLGRQSIGGYLNLGVYYLFAVPLSLFLTFGPPKLDLEGLWVGPCFGLMICTFCIGGYMCYTDWEGAVEDARRREE